MDSPMAHIPVTKETMAKKRLKPLETFNFLANLPDIFKAGPGSFKPVPVKTDDVASLLDQIFLPFNQVDNRYCRQAGGTGLGLSLVRGLAQLHGGTAWIDSDVGKGVKAYVEFPPIPRDLLRRSA